MNNSIAIITARGGSKRIPRKNIKDFLGRPIIAYSIEAAINAGCFNEIMVSTDDDEIAKIAESLGAKVPFLRSPENSDDYSTTADVIKEVIIEYRNRGMNFDSLCCIYPTAPFVNATKLKNGMQMLSENKVDCVLPVVRYSYPIQRSLKIEEGKIVMNWPENYFARSQDLTPVYHDCGQFYCMNTQSLLSQMKLFADNTLPIITSEEEVQDIDNEEDWRLAEIKYSMLQKINPA
ncbi:MAG: pseudaminic acid cytidylyltransferase [Ferruginibacter sp.]